MNSRAETVIIFFDGVCHLCNGFVDFLIQKDRHKKLHFAPLQGNTAKEHLNEEQRQKLSTVIVVTPEMTLEKSDAVIFSLALLGGIYRLVNVLRILPKPLRDSIYDLIARNRYAWFGERESCRLPTAQEKDQLLP